MGAALVFFVACLIGKDVAFVPFPYVIRGAAQILFLTLGLGTLLPILSPGLLIRYWPVLGYLLVLLVTAPFTPFPVFVLLQVLSLASAVVFAMAYFERRSDEHKDLGTLLLSTVLVYGIVACLSLALIKLQPTLAYDAQFVGEEAGYENRFRGLLSRSGVMGAASGLLVGLAVIGIKRWPLKVALAVPGLLCLALSQSRSFWLAAIAAGGATAWIYYPRLRKWVWVSAGGAAFLAAASLAFNISVDTSGVHAFARLDTVKDLTGRTELWQAAYRGWSERPWLGYGFTLGGMGLGGEHVVSADADPTQFSRQTLHNGYIQSLMDAGIVGFLLYAMTVVISITR